MVLPGISTGASERSSLIRLKARGMALVLYKKIGWSLFKDRLVVVYLEASET